MDGLWNSPNPQTSIEHKLKKCGEGLSIWSSRKHKQSSEEVHMLTKRQKELEDMENQDVIGKITRLQ